MYTGFFTHSPYQVVVTIKRYFLSAYDFVRLVDYYHFHHRRQFTHNENILRNFSQLVISLNLRFQKWIIN